MAKLFIICGHGDGDPGACGNGFTEAERVRRLAERIKLFGGDAVTIGDPAKNWYKDNLISSLSPSKDHEILELHMNSHTNTKARGGNIYIKEGFTPDEYDHRLADFLGSILPGRSELIVKRSDLANPKRAAAKGYSYRLAEVGFISNADDVAIFNSQMDEIAKGIIRSFNIQVDYQSNILKLYRVQIGAFNDRSNAERLLEEIKGKGYEDAFINSV